MNISSELLANAVNIEKGNILDIVTFPHPVLTKVASPVEVFDPHLQELALDMLHTMYKAPGIGLAAPQIGKSIQLFVIDVDFKRKKVFGNTQSLAREELEDEDEDEGEDEYTEYEYSEINPRIFINPRIIFSEGSVKCKEGCLSLPELYEEVERAAKIVIEYQDLNGKKETLNAEGLLAICIQHEYDHLQGKLLLDKISLFKRNFYKKKMVKAQRRAVTAERIGEE